MLFAPGVELGTYESNALTIELPGLSRKNLLQWVASSNVTNFIKQHSCNRTGNLRFQHSKLVLIRE